VLQQGTTWHIRHITAQRDPVQHSMTLHGPSA
jgi:hypothetical protein